MRILSEMIKIGSVGMICVLASLKCLSASAQDESALVAQAEDLVFELEQSDFDSTPVDEWARTIRELVEIGGPAVEPICSALRATDRNFQMRAYAYALRAINDPRAVPTLIETIPKTLLPLAMENEDKGMKVRDRELMKFMLANDIYRSPAGRFRFARPAREVMAAICSITDHEVDHRDSLPSTYLGHGAAQIRMKRLLFHERAVLWKDWWENNAR